jgi:hypothetical protein
VPEIFSKFVMQISKLKIKLNVGYVRREYNDEHFDLKSINQLCGKTIYFACSHLKNADPTLTNNLQVIKTRV